MTLDNLQYALYLNNKFILDRIKNLRDALDNVVSTDIDELKRLIDEISNSDLSDIRKLINDLDTALSNHVNDTVVHVTQEDKDLWNATLQNAKDYAKKLFDGVTSFSIQVVDSLPEENIHEMTIYFIRNGRENESDYYEEYMYINGKWEIIGSTFVNLAPYLLKTDFEAYQREITDKFLEYNTSEEITNILKSYLLTSDFETALKNYSTTTEIGNLLKSYLLTTDFQNTLKDYSTTDEVTKILEDYAQLKDLHEHTNLEILEKLSQSDSGNLLFDGQEIKGGADTTISEEKNNAIIQKDDGIFVEDKTEQINNIQIQANQISFAQKIVNTELDYCYLTSSHNWTTVSGDISSYFDKQKTNMNIDSNGHVILKANKVYLVTFDVLSKTEASYVYIMTPCTNICGDKGGYHVSNTQSSTSKIIYPDEDTIVYPQASSNSILCLCHGAFVVQEINRKILIDPVEYINGSQGVEDTPVGHVLSCVGNNPPKHYLICDGTEYNIMDYPYLAQHIKEECGSVNYFGGDGVNTFCVPNITEKDWTCDESFLVDKAGVVSYINGRSYYKYNDGKAVMATLYDSINNYTRTYLVSTEQDAVVSYCSYNTSMLNTSLANHVKKTEYLGLEWYVGLIPYGWYPNYSTSGKAPRLPDTSLGTLEKIGQYILEKANTRLDLESIYLSKCIKYEPTYYMTVGQYTVQGFEDYSLEEIVIGRWINGKPIYRKVIPISGIYKSGDIIYPNDFFLDKEYLNIWGYGETNQWIANFSSSYYNKYSNFGFGFYLLKGTGLIFDGDNDGAFTNNSRIILEYTKTTDAENSFKPEMLSTIIINGSQGNQDEEDITDEQIQQAIIADTF